MALPEMKNMLEGLHNHPFMDEVNKCIQIKEWRKKFVREMNTAIDLAENYRKETDKLQTIQIPSTQEVELREFFKKGLELIDSYLSQYRKGDTHNGNPNTSI